MSGIGGPWKIVLSSRCPDWRLRADSFICVRIFRGVGAVKHEAKHTKACAKLAGADVPLVHRDPVLGQMLTKAMNRSRPTTLMQAAVHQRYDKHWPKGHDPWGAVVVTLLSQHVTLVVSLQYVVERLALPKSVPGEFVDI